MRNMVHKVAKFIEQKKLLAEGERVLVAISGGADSVALLVALQKLGYRCEAIHCNFHLRGEESLRDENFVRALCHKYNIPLYVVDFDTAEYAAKNSISIEMAAREQRYDAFKKRLAETGISTVAVAHHRDDSAETLLLNLMRGTGIKGLHGIQPKNGHIVRPLLSVSREEILEYLNWRGESYVTDSTNLKTDFTRNKIRLEIIPLMQQINPSVAESIAQTAERVSEAEKVYIKAIGDGIARVKDGNKIDICRLKEESSPQSLLYEILQPLGFNSSQIKEIAYTAEGDESGRIFTCDKWQVVKDRSTLIITSQEREIIHPTTLQPNSSIKTGQGTITCTLHPFNGHIERSKNHATLDCEKVSLPLTVRRWQQGDRFCPFGMRGSKLLSDYMTDCKMSILDKEQQLVVTDSNGKIVWVVGERIASHCSTDGNTKNVICLQWNNQ